MKNFAQIGHYHFAATAVISRLTIRPTLYDNRAYGVQRNDTQVCRTRDGKTEEIMRMPGGELSNRPLHFIWICDVSGSMAGAKIATLNFAIREAIPEMVKVADENPNAQVLVRAVKFSNGAQWAVPQPTPVADFKWTDLITDSVTDMGKALALVADQLKMPPMTDRALPPVLVLISDGQPTDDFNLGLKLLLDQPWGKKAVRIAIGIGSDADSHVLQKFIANPELKVLTAHNPEQLVRQIKWSSTAVLKAASAPASQAASGAGPVQNVPIPSPPATSPSSPGDVW